MTAAALPRCIELQLRLAGGDKKLCLLRVVAAGTEQFDVSGHTGTTSGTWNDVVVLKIGFGTAVATAAAVAFPNELSRIVADARIISVAALSQRRALAARVLR